MKTLLILAAMTLLTGLTSTANAQRRDLLDRFRRVTSVASTVPPNGDLNPYGTVVIPESRGKLREHGILVSNFNDAANEQGTGTTIVQVQPNGGTELFSEIDASKLPGPCPGGIGLTTALTVLRTGWVIVGSLPTADGTSATAQAGCLLVLDRSGRVIETISGPPINGPWDMTSFDFGPWAVLFVTNVLNGTVAGNGNVVNGGTVVRVVLRVSDVDAPRVVSQTVIGSGFGEKTDPDALVVGPTGVGLAMDGTLYVADTVANRIAALHESLFRTTSGGTGVTVSEGGALNSPLGLAVAHDGHILTVDAGDGNIVETTPSGHQVDVLAIDNSGSPPGAGALFGLAMPPHENGIYFVDDADNTLKFLH